MSNYPDLDSSLLSLLVVLRAVSAEVSFLSAPETCFIVVAPLALFLGKSVVELSSGFSVLGLVLHLAGYNSVSIIIVSATISFCVSYVRLEIFLLVILFLKSVINTRS